MQGTPAQARYCRSLSVAGRAIRISVKAAMLDASGLAGLRGRVFVDDYFRAPGTGIPTPETVTPKSSLPELVSGETPTSEINATNSGPFRGRGEPCANARLRGGPEKTRTTCLARSHFEPVSLDVTVAKDGGADQGVYS
jgi:hypothetical protein